MAVPPQYENQAFLREVDEEVRRDQLLRFWQANWRWVIGGIVALLVAYGGTLLWQNHRQAATGEVGEKLDDAFVALGSNKTAEGNRLLREVADSGIPGYRAAALFSEADIALRAAGNDPAKLKAAAQKFAAIANDESLPQGQRDLALVRQTSAEYDTLKPQVIIDRLRPLAGKGKPYFAIAGEMTAMAYLDQGRADLAQQLFSQIGADPQTPESIRQRAVQMASSTALGTPNPQEQKAR